MAKYNYGAPEKSDRLFGERRSSGVIESLRKQIFEGAGARDTELVTTKLRISLFAASMNACPTVLTDILLAGD